MRFLRVLATVVGVSALLGFFFTPAVAQNTKASSNEEAVADDVFNKLLQDGFTISIPSLAELKSQIEIHGDVAIFNVPVTLKTTDGARETLEAATRRLGGQTVEAFFEADYGIVSWEARALRLSANPRTLEYFQRRIDSIAFVLRLNLDDGDSYECRTDDVWRLPIAPVRQLFVYGGRGAIQGLGLSPVFDGKDVGFVASRKKPITFIYRGTIPAGDFARIVKMEGKIVEAKEGSDDESQCLKASARSQPTAQEARP
jgi:hypothetical protein